jgi:hypothetical protein
MSRNTYIKDPTTFIPTVSASKVTAFPPSSIPTYVGGITQFKANQIHWSIERGHQVTREEAMEAYAQEEYVMARLNMGGVFPSGVAWDDQGYAIYLKDDSGAKAWTTGTYEKYAPSGLAAQLFGFGPDVLGMEYFILEMEDDGEGEVFKSQWY